MDLRRANNPERFRGPKVPSPEGLRCLTACAALLVGHRSTGDMLPPRALRRPKINQQRGMHGFFNSLLTSVATRARQGAESSSAQSGRGRLVSEGARGTMLEIATG
jgi:hypothetical protein